MAASGELPDRLLPATPAGSYSPGELATISQMVSTRVEPASLSAVVLASVTPAAFAVDSRPLGPAGGSAREACVRE